MTLIPHLCISKEQRDKCALSQAAVSSLTYQVLKISALICRIAQMDIGNNVLGWTEQRAAGEALAVIRSSLRKSLMQLV